MIGEDSCKDTYVKMVIIGTGTAETDCILKNTKVAIWMQREVLVKDGF